MDLPPEVRTALLSLLLEAIKELIALIRHMIEQVIGVRTIPVPVGGIPPTE